MRCIPLARALQYLKNITHTAALYVLLCSIYAQHYHIPHCIYKLIEVKNVYDLKMRWKDRHSWAREVKGSPCKGIRRGFPSDRVQPMPSVPFSFHLVGLVDVSPSRIFSFFLSNCVLEIRSFFARGGIYDTDVAREEGWAKDDMRATKRRNTKGRRGRVITAGLYI